MREEFHALEMELPEFTAVLDGMTKNTYILLIVHDPTIGMRGRPPLCITAPVPLR
jgi:hypothetical protein